MERVNLSAGEWRVMEELWKAPATLMELVRAWVRAPDGQEHGVHSGAPDGGQGPH